MVSCVERNPKAKEEEDYPESDHQTEQRNISFHRARSGSRERLDKFQRSLNPHSHLLLDMS